MDQVLPPASAALSNLEELVLFLMGTPILPVSVARALKRLRSLDLTGNNITQIPAALSLMTTLERVHLSSRLKVLQLELSDMNTLVKLPHLTKLCLGVKHCSSQNNENVMVAIKERFPKIILDA
jgi:Leucine-rich repeat (LRR) protein